jgi:hypothetical protein
MGLICLWCSCLVLASHPFLFLGECFRILGSFRGCFVVWIFDGVFCFLGK